VLFFVHGGAFFHGAGSESFYNGATLAKTWDVVVVTANYRLGALGFLNFSSLDDRFTGNNGLRDVILSLEWVRDNIDNFGGDPGNITVFGQSAGGTVVSTLATLPRARQCMSKCIIMSGGPTQLQDRDECVKTSQAFLDFMRIQRSRQLMDISLVDLAKGQKDFMGQYGLGAATFRLTMDEDLIPEHPIPAARSGATAGLPMLIGTTREEMALLMIKPLAKILDVHKIVYEGFMQESEQTRKNLSSLYTTRYGERRGLSMLYTDLLFRISSVWFAQEASAHSPTWMYRFDYETLALRMNGLHAFHSTDLPYTFGNLKSVLVRPMFLLNPDMSPIYSVAHEIQHDFISFARSGTLPWAPCDAHQVPAKCYDLGFPIQPMVEDVIREAYQDTVYRARSLRSRKGS
jgi:para-nitrobenzyl esterase